MIASTLHIERSKVKAKAAASCRRSCSSFAATTTSSSSSSPIGTTTGSYVRRASVHLARAKEKIAQRLGDTLID